MPAQLPRSKRGSRRGLLHYRQKAPSRARGTPLRRFQVSGVREEAPGGRSLNALQGLSRRGLAPLFDHRRHGHVLGMKLGDRLQKPASIAGVLWSAIFPWTRVSMTWGVSRAGTLGLDTTINAKR